MVTRTVKDQLDDGAQSLDASREKIAADLAEARAALRERGNEIADTAGDYVRSHPLRAMAAAAAVGMLAGVLLARR